MTSYNSSVPLSTSETYLHPWYIALQRLGNTTTCASASTRKQPTETTGVKPTNVQQKNKTEIKSVKKKTRQGNGRNSVPKGDKKAYRGQGR